MSDVWNYFKKVEKEKARCIYCNKMLTCKGSSTSSLHNHLKTVHDKVTEKKSSDAGPSSQTSTQPCILNFVKRTSLEEIVSKLAALDGLSINCITNSSFIRESLQQRNYCLPQNNSRVMNLIYKFYETINELNCMKNTGQKFFITIDEWTSKGNRRYLNISVHQLEKDFNLGLAPISSTCDATTMLKLVSEKLKTFNLDLSTDIVASTNDGAAVMKKFGHISPAINQLCYSHAILLAVTDILYNKNKSPLETDLNPTSEDSENDESDNDFEELDSLDINNYKLPVPELLDDYKNIICKVRKICKYFRKSPVKNSILQNHVKRKYEKEYNLILDCKTRWNSLEAMLERFVHLKECVVLTLNDLNASHMWNEDEEYYKVEELLKVLGPIKLAAEALGRQDANLLTSEGIFEFLLGELQNLKSEISQKLLHAIKARIEERRDTVLVTLILYLQNSQTVLTKSSNKFLPLATKSDIIKLSGQILSRLYKDYSTGEECDIQKRDESDIQEPDNVLLKNAMEVAINKYLKEPEEVTSSTQTLRKEFLALEATNKRTKNLELLYQALKTIKPSSVASERVFSISVNFVNKLRTQLNSKSIDVLCFLKSYFIKQKNK